MYKENVQIGYFNFDTIIFEKKKALIILHLSRYYLRSLTLFFNLYFKLSEATQSCSKNMNTKSCKDIKCI